MTGREVLTVVAVAGGLAVIGLLILAVGTRAARQAEEQRLLVAFATDHDGQLFLLATRRGGWFDFLRNNVIPLLPSGTEVVWYPVTSGRKPDDPSVPESPLHLLGRRLAKPTFVRFSSGSSHVIPLPLVLTELRSHGKRDPAVQERVRACLATINTGDTTGASTRGA